MEMYISVQKCTFLPGYESLLLKQYGKLPAGFFITFKILI